MTSLSGGYYTTVIKSGFRLVSLNTVYYYTNDKLTANVTDPANQFRWFDDVMINATSNNEKVCKLDLQCLRSTFKGSNYLPVENGCVKLLRWMSIDNSNNNNSNKIIIIITTVRIAVRNVAGLTRQCLLLIINFNVWCYYGKAELERVPVRGTRRKFCAKPNFKKTYWDSVYTEKGREGRYVQTLKFSWFSSVL